MKSGFTLIELAIVLVIVGLLSGGILTAQTLIRASEMRAVQSEFQRYTTAVNAFRERYFGLPGDLPNATRFWKRQYNSTACPSPSGAVLDDNGTCDGNGDGNILAASAAGESGEFAQFWRQLALAGLVEGMYTGRAGPGGIWHGVREVNIPASKLGNAAWSEVFWATQDGNASLFNGAYGNTLLLGGQDVAIEPIQRVLRPEEAWNLDAKIDDGMPAVGKVVVRNRIACAIAPDGGSMTFDPLMAGRMDAVYNVQYDDGYGCALIFRGNF